MHVLCCEVLWEGIVLNVATGNNKTLMVRCLFKLQSHLKSSVVSAPAWQTQARMRPYTGSLFFKLGAKTYQPTGQRSSRFLVLWIRWVQILGSGLKCQRCLPHLGVSPISVRLKTFWAHLQSVNMFWGVVRRSRPKCDNRQEQDSDGQVFVQTAITSEIRCGVCVWSLLYLSVGSKGWWLRPMWGSNPRPWD